ncbi:MAG: 3-isopropylmalate dehydratase, small subunit [Fibrobacteres bacterium]|nr:3-isopropylmalate dehydratase, small subunit [Fibrobacterota bacterium]
MSVAQAIIAKVQARAIPVRGNDIDTDRIIPARFLRCVVFDGLGEHSFEDDRLGLKAKGQTHAFDDARYQGAGILFVNKNFGCGSSREHAPQALMRWGIKAIVGESFAEIFFGNCVALGIPCFTASEASLARLMDAAEKSPTSEWTVDVEAGLVKGSAGATPVQESATLPQGPKSQFLSGRWNSLNELLLNLPVVDKVAAGLPYVSGW